MTAPERIVVACSGDREAAELVWETLQGVRLLREEGLAQTHPRPAALLTEQLCPNCKQPYDQGACGMCGALEKQETTGAPS